MRLRKKIAALCSAVLIGVTALTPLNPSAPVSAASNYVNYAEALQKSLYLYDANMCGTGVDENAGLSWRTDCHKDDASRQVSVNGTNYTVDVSGGYHDAGDHIKFALPAGMAFTTLNLGYYKFKSAYDASGQTAHLKRIMAYETDYLKRCIIRNAQNQIVGFVVQVGDNTSDQNGNADHQYWGSPESQPYTKRDIAVATAQNQSASEIMASVCVLASTYVNFGGADLLQAAKDLYSFGESQTAERTCPFYGTGNNTQASYKAWAAAWLNKADGGNRNVATKNGNGWCLSWSDVWGGVAALQGYISNTQTVNNLNTNTYLVPGNSKWGSARNNFALQLEAICNDQKWTEAQWQTDFLFGNNTKQLSFMVGYGTNSPKNPHHRAANPNNGKGAGSWNETTHTPMTDAQGTKHVLVGALVGGPESSSANDYWDSLTNYVSNEVTLDYNASMVGVLAGLYSKYGTSDKPVATNSIPEVRVIGDEWDQTGTVNPGTTTTTAPTTSNGGDTPTTTSPAPNNGMNTVKPDEKLTWNDETVKYVVPLTDLMNVGDKLIKIEVDVNAATAITYSGAMAISADPSTKWDAFDADWLAFLKRLEQDNGWALDLKAGKNTFTFEIPVAYRNDVNVEYGEFQLCFWYSGTFGASVTVTEVRAYVETTSGGTTSTSPTTATTTTSRTTTSTTTVPTTSTTRTTATTTSRTTTGTTQAPNPSVIYGDVDGNSTVNIADVVVLAKFISGKSSLTTAQKTKADVTLNNVVNVEDLLGIIRFVFGEIKSLPIQ